MPSNKANVRYSQSEAARRLGISVEQLRMLVRNYITVDEELPDNATFQASDLVVLRVLAGYRQKSVVY